MPRYVSPLDEYLKQQEEEKAYLLETLDNELSMLNSEAGARATQIEADTSAPDFFAPRDIPAGLSFDDQVRYMGFERERAQRQGKADLAAELADRRAEVLDDRNSQLRDYLDTRKRLSLVDQKGVLNLLRKGAVPRNDGLRMEIVPSVDKEGNPVYQQVYKKVDESTVRTQELADWLGVPPEIAERQIEHESLIEQQAKKKALREQMELTNAANKEKRAQERFARQMAADERRKLFDTISLTKEAANEPGLIGTVIKPDSLPAQLAMQRVAFQRLVGEGGAKLKMAGEIEDAVEKDLNDAIGQGDLTLPTGPDDIEGKQKIIQFVEQSRIRHTTEKKLIRGAIQKGGFEDFGVGSLEKNLADDWMQEIQRRARGESALPPALAEPLPFVPPETPEPANAPALREALSGTAIPSPGFDVRLGQRAEDFLDFLLHAPSRTTEVISNRLKLSREALGELGILSPTEEQIKKRLRRYRDKR